MSTCTTYRQLQPEERLTIASLRQQGKGIRAIARTLGRSPCTVSREIARNSVQGSYASVPAQLRCQQRRIHARPLPKLHPDGVLMGIVHYFLRRHWSPQQIALILATLYPLGHPYRVSHETIYNCIYATPVGTLVERTSRLLMLVKLPHPQPASAANVLQAFTDKLLSITEPMRKTLTYDQGREMARHKGASLEIRS